MLLLTKSQIDRFNKTIQAYYEAHGRHALPWRIPLADGSFDPYAILVSEVMLQQTQVSRVIQKFQDFMVRFPTVDHLAHASLAEVLEAWSGLGYNRRAKFLWQASQHISQDFGGVFPEDVRVLQTLPGVGSNTAGAVVVYAFNQPSSFIETNIRTVFIYHFLQNRQDISDTEIRNLLEQTLPRDDPRGYFWAIMDYGSYVKKTIGNSSRASNTYIKQAPFHGSLRQIRGQVVRALLGRPLSYRQLANAQPDPRLKQVLSTLEAEGFIEYVENHYRLLADKKLMVE
jgi:A/G-specific adenine glycosylase